MSQNFVLDTNVVLALLRGNALGSRIDQDFRLSASLYRHVVSFVTAAELFVLADRNGWGTTKREALEQALQNLVVLPVDGEDLLEAYVKISPADYSAAGGSRNLGKNDVWIAATALLAGMPLLTTDKDFRFLHGSLLQVMWIDPERSG